MTQSILAYNPVLAKKLILGRTTEVLKPFLTNADLFEKYQKVFGRRYINSMIDRTGQLPHFLRIKQIDQLPTLANISFEKAVETRAKSLLSHNKHIRVLWSGGLDSTFTLFALLEYAQPGQVSVFGTYSSLMESGSLFDRHIRTRVEYDIGVFTQDLKPNKEYMFVSGMLGNQIFGPGNVFDNEGCPKQYGTADTIHSDYRTVVNEEVLEFLDPSIKAFPKKLETVEDFRWYLMFNFPWQSLRLENNIYLPQETYGVIHPFFDSVEIQQWAMSTDEPKQKDPTDILTHRWQMRELIDRWIGPNDYTKRKDKTVSILYTKPKDWFALLDNYTNIYFKDAP